MRRAGRVNNFKVICLENNTKHSNHKGISVPAQPLLSFKSEGKIL